MLERGQNECKRENLGVGCRCTLKVNQRHCIELSGVGAIPLDYWFVYIGRLLAIASLSLEERDVGALTSLLE